MKVTVTSSKGPSAFNPVLSLVSLSIRSKAVSSLAFVASIVKISVVESIEYDTGKSIGRLSEGSIVSV